MVAVNGHELQKVKKSKDEAACSHPPFLSDIYILSQPLMSYPDALHTSKCFQVTKHIGLMWQ